MLLVAFALSVLPRLSTQISEPIPPPFVQGKLVAYMTLETSTKYRLSADQKRNSAKIQKRYWNLFFRHLDAEVVQPVKAGQPSKVPYYIVPEADTYLLSTLSDAQRKEVNRIWYNRAGVFYCMQTIEVQKILGMSPDQVYKSNQLFDKYRLEVLDLLKKNKQKDISVQLDERPYNEMTGSYSKMAVNLLTETQRSKWASMLKP